MNAWTAIIGFGVILILAILWLRGRRIPSPRRDTRPLVLTRYETHMPQSAHIPELSQMARELGKTYSEHDRAANRIVRDLTDKR
jgi:non-ribosomal peptide synthetase component F